MSTSGVTPGPAGRTVYTFRRAAGTVAETVAPRTTIPVLPAVCPSSTGTSA